MPTNIHSLSLKTSPSDSATTRFTGQQVGSSKPPHALSVAGVVLYTATPLTPTGAVAGSYARHAA